ncbi:MAG: bifunctional nicotinamidase/pyrazinamidase [Alphaproteobacteria bacterium]|nr:bifunctional nicotinamidase/pyrazinamidase [Alphaproteobacteria bacterium]
MPKALLVIDVQNDFCPGGALAVPHGDEVVGPCNVLISEFPLVVLTQDWHPVGHRSFASSHPGRSPFESVTLPYGPQVLWPDHCVQGTHGAELHRSLHTHRARWIVRKGHDPAIDSYSAFQENDRRTTTGLVGALRELGVDEVVICGLATDYCVRYSAIDAVEAGFRATVVEEACRGIDLDGSVGAAWDAMGLAGVRRVERVKDVRP